MADEQRSYRAATGLLEQRSHDSGRCEMESEELCGLWSDLRLDLRGIELR